MSSRVAVPVKVARLRVHLQKGRHWTAVDHLVLWALAAKALDSELLSSEMEIPRSKVFSYILRWIAWKIQHPGELSDVAIAVGPKGDGASLPASGNDADLHRPGRYPCLDGASAPSAPSPSSELAKELAYCKRHKGTKLIVATLSRLTRDTRFLLTLLDGNVEVVFAMSRCWWPAPSN